MTPPATDEPGPARQFGETEPRRPDAPPSTAPHNLPATLTHFVGRREELRALHDLLLRERLVTLTGVGGTGKTRLALETARQALPDFPGGAFFVPLDPVAAPDQLAFALIEALQITSYLGSGLKADLFNFLRDRRILLVLDNFEHLIAGAGLLVEILQQARQVAMLITSRERLNVYGECIFEVGGLPLPEDDTLAAAGRSAAVQLFVQSAQRACRTFALAQENCRQVVRICRLVEGLPLALEMSGAWLRSMGCAEIAAQIERDLDFLTADWQDVPERRRSMRATIEHSWSLLDAAEQRSFARLAVFRGDFTAEAACAAAGISIPQLAALADKSLLRWDAGRSLYSIHPLLKRFAAERLAENPEDERRVRDLHGAHYLALLAERAAALPGGTARDIGDALGDIRAAWEWAAEHRQVEPLAGAMDCLFRFYEMRGLAEEGLQLFAHAAERVEEPAALAWNLRARQGACLVLQEMFDAGRQLLESCLTAFRAADDPAGAALCLLWLGRERLLQSKHAESAAYLREAAALARAHALRGVEAGSLDSLGESDIAQGRLADAQQTYQAALDAYRALGDRRGEAKALRQYGAVATHLGDYDTAIAYGRLALELFAEIGDAPGEALACDLIGGSYVYQGRLSEALAYQRRSLDLARRLGSHARQARALGNLGFNLYGQGDYENARLCYEQALALARQSGIRDLEGRTLVNLAGLAIAAGNSAAAREHCEQALALAEASGNRGLQQYALTTLGHALLGLESPDRAQAAYRRAAALHRELKRSGADTDLLAGQARAALALSQIARARAYVDEILQAKQDKKALDSSPTGLRVYLACYRVLRTARDPRAAGVLQEAYALLQDKALLISDEAARRRFLENVTAHRELLREYAYVRPYSAAAGTAAPAQEGIPPMEEPLTRQEQEVLRLLAEGFSNQQIAERLVNSVGTIKFHIHNIYGKLGVRNRTQAVARARQLGLI